jgi:hypothetical protein
MPVIECLGALIIDEVSMVPPDIVDCINNTLKKARRDTQPFGGVPVIFVGDLLQLPPVVIQACGGMARKSRGRHRQQGVPCDKYSVDDDWDQEEISHIVIVPHLLDRTHLSNFGQR